MTTPVRTSCAPTGAEDFDLSNSAVSIQLKALLQLPYLTKLLPNYCQHITDVGSKPLLSLPYLKRVRVLNCPGVSVESSQALNLRKPREKKEDQGVDRMNGRQMVRLE